MKHNNNFIKTSQEFLTGLINSRLLISTIYLIYESQKHKNKNKYKCIYCGKFSVKFYTDTNKAHCFSCNQQISITDIIKKCEGLDFMESIKHLLKEHMGIDLENESDRIELNLKEKLNDIHYIRLLKYNESLNIYRKT